MPFTGCRLGASFYVPNFLLTPPRSTVAITFNAENAIAKTLLEGSLMDSWRWASSAVRVIMALRLRLSTKGARLEPIGSEVSIDCPDERSFLPAGPSVVGPIEISMEGNSGSFMYVRENLLELSRLQERPFWNSQFFRGDSWPLYTSSGF
jgi:hypothetical protein